MSNTNNFQDGLNNLSNFPKTLQKEAIVQGTVTSVNNGYLTMDVGYRADGVVSGAEMYVDGDRAIPAIGDILPVFVINDGAYLGYPLLSIKKTGATRKWDELEAAKGTNKIYDGLVMEVNTGGAMVVLPGDIKGFVPTSQIEQSRFADMGGKKWNMKDKETVDKLLAAMQPMVGSKLKLTVLDVDKKKKKAVFSEKGATYAQNNTGNHHYDHDMEIDPAQLLQKTEFLLKVKIGDVMEATVTGISNFGVFVNSQGVEGLIHISQLSWKKVELGDIERMYKVGDKVSVKVISVDEENKRIGFSVKMLEKDPWANISDRFKVGDKITAKVTKIMDYGAFVQVEDGVYGLLHNSEVDDNSKVKASDILNEGEDIELKIIAISSSDRHLGVSRRGL